ncbi:FBP domain-containing protein [Luteimicrobium subarcticum]|uniref:Treble-clef zinc-finger protein n=1 Tax=Luteimicrobium subarcticum TaxID=620910 RepID=A0A2M8WTH5_9MICO|nr:FBP domain-containing protein [Luteimicrobium subarcticum]PJI94188.1 treble-clef zinc-finger protein [Luteimicrobium subarcticum]
MIPLTERQIRTSFVNTSKREASQAVLPDLDALDWDRLDYLGWQDRKAPLMSYAVVPVDDEPVGILLRATDPAGRVRRSAVCAWCEDVVETSDVGLFVARRAGAAGRRGDTVGTLICEDFRCSRNVRRRLTATEAGNASDEERAVMTALRIEGLRERSARFVAEVAREV